LLDLHRKIENKPGYINNERRFVGKLYKYPRTPHLPWSPGATSGDKVLKDTNHFDGKELIASIKMDGECTTLYPDYIHARSPDSKDHESRHWIKSFHAGIKHMIPNGWRICGENLFAKHSIHYTTLTSYFYGFSVWDDRNVCLDYSTTEEFFNDLGICSVVAFSNGPLEKIDATFHRNFTENAEGYVVRLIEEFKYDDFGLSVAKYVRANHVQTDKHWMFRKVERNGLAYHN
jgi:hypothetical protein